MESSWTGTVTNVRGSWVRPASLWGLFAVPLMVAIMLGITSVGAAPVLAQRVPAAAASPPGTGLAWGDNADSQLGDGTTTNSSTPVAVDLPAGTTITAVAAGNAHSLALASTGTMLAWGANFTGQLGNGTTTSSSTPIAVDLPAGTTITTVAAGQGHSLALTSTGTILAWGYNASGQLGDGTNSNSSTPIAVDLPADTTTTAVTGGSFHSLAIVPSASTSTTTLQVSPPNPTPDQPVTLTATATCTGSTPTGTVTFLDGTTVLGTEPLSGNPTATATLTVTRLAPGTHRIQARYNGDSNCPASTSNSTTVTVPEPTVPKPTIPVTGTSLPTILTAGILLTLTGTALTLATRRRRPTHRP